MAETLKKFTIKSELPSPAINQLKWLLKLKIGQYLPGFPSLHRNYQQYVSIQEKFRQWMLTTPHDRLDKQEIATYTNNDLELCLNDAKGRKEVFESRPIEKTFQGMSLPLIREIIRTDGGIRSILEVGAYYGYANSILAREYPEIQVYGVDFVPFMKQLNAEFQELNLHFLSGYALDMLESGEIAGDIVYFVSTATRLKNQEFKRYLNAIRKQGRYVVVNEPLIYLPGKGLADPDRVDADHSIPVVYEGSGAEMAPCHIHNYRAIAEVAGYDVLHYHVYIPAFTYDHYRIEMVAKKK